ncbi:MAG: SigB/SigF/SigG family RNA polymerase sigma factor [Eubacteriales bacterium]|nr:SigB/SigF/SigG family RNA polymerase sigma factor [Eubacteriales bacterium]
MRFGKVSLSCIDTGELKTLTHEEKLELLKRIRSGDEEARAEFINGNLRLVLSIIQRFSNRGETPDDLFQVGCIGLMKATDHFDLAQDVRFSTYAVPMIIGELRRYLRDNNSVRVSRSLRDVAYKAMRAREELIAAGVAEPDCAAIAGRLGLSERQVRTALDAIAEPVSLQEPVYAEGDESLLVMDQLSDGTAENQYENIALDCALKKLSKRESDILTMRYFQGKTQTEVAKAIGISQAQVSRLEKSALSHMKKNL